MHDPSRDQPACLGCVAREREIHRLRIRGRMDFDELEEARSDIRSLRRAVHRLRLQLDAAEDRLAAFTTPEEPHHAEDPAP